MYLVEVPQIAYENEIINMIAEAKKTQTIASFKKIVVVDEYGYCGLCPNCCPDRCAQTLRDEWYIQSRILSGYDYQKTRLSL